MITILAALVTGATAGEWEPPQPYARPKLYMQAISINGSLSAQAVIGAEGGLLTRYNEPPHWLNQSRVAAAGIIGLSTGTFGADARVGSFWGPDMKYLTVLSGPDIWFNGYGSPTSTDIYYLPWSPGIDIRTQATLKPAEVFHIIGTATPGWAFAGARGTGGLGPFHEFTLSAAARVATGRFMLMVGYQRQWNSVGVIEGIIFAIGI